MDGFFFKTIEDLLAECRIDGPAVVHHRNEMFNGGRNYWAEVHIPSRSGVPSLIAHCVDEDDAKLIAALINFAYAKSLE